MPSLCLKLPARRENVAVVRQAIGGLADSLRLGPDVLTNMKLAVTEACANVVLHAYDGPGGDLVLEVYPEPDRRAVTVIVRDHGNGFHPKVQVENDSSWRLGMPLIASTTEGFEVGQAARGGGTEVRMRFAAGAANGEPRSALQR